MGRKDECTDGQHEYIEWLKAEPSLAQQDGRECKDIITRDPKEGDGDLITRTQSFIRQKAGHDKSKFKEAAIEIALLQKSPASQVWFMGCGQLLIEELEV